MTKEEVRIEQSIGDDLGDGLDYDVEFSEPESGARNEISGDEYVNVNEDDFQEDIKTAKAKTETNEGKKRKAKSTKLQEKKRLKMEMDTDQKKNLSKESSTETIVDYINTKIRQKNSDLSALELGELYFNKSDIRSTSDFNVETRNLDNLSKFIVARFKNMLPSTGSKKEKKNKKSSSQKKSKEYTDPNEERKFIAIISMSAIRACDIHRATKELAGSSLKVINKNKIEVDLKLLKTTTSRVLCCTPGRLIKVLDNEDQVLKKEEIKIVVVDNSYLDSKQQNIWDIKETTDALKSLTKNGSKVYLY
ncbi:Predicted DEAD-box-containing helicase [Scheffersomyces stipitis CBS 6054]|uniref:Predicted DEAD-box-containing helicase n=1 Tax=Scheffersomyces stipitis (strain ATCC 58785 / CBS 6054 / NBRC 10063 / NRRL Y-11545) TaxID=322104 RepID=A3LWW6_PICST|nr:Predicted DEAD-box-containing helicase [Scheffersomyces stipitis CBS 6054]ABN67353.1 Predicted DEAD-box-containing helicase [Scheffersomyces stipitis CBS 6054]KAG2731978.1 hypothetical protein G9P44_004395 [Scheffersomyces stipitis]